MAQKVLAPQEHASGEKKLNCALSARSSKRKKIRILSARSRIKVTSPTANRKYLQEVCSSWVNQQYTDLEPCYTCKRQTRTAKCYSDFAPFSRMKKQKTSTCNLENVNNLTSMRKWLKSRRQKICRSTFT